LPAKFGFRSVPQGELPRSAATRKPALGDPNVISRQTIYVAALLAACTGAAESNDPLRTAPPIELVEELRLDPMAEDFSVVTNIGVGPRGQIAVLLPQDGQVRLFDSTGARLAAIGRRGSGPGEFQFPARVGWVADTM
jgi:hypothetical protein